MTPAMLAGWGIATRLLLISTVLFLLGGCANSQAYERIIRKDPWGTDRLACVAQARRDPGHTAHVAGQVLMALVLSPILLTGGVSPTSLTLCMGELGWTPKHPDAVGRIQAEGMDWRPMTPAQVATWPSTKAAIQAWEQDRSDSISKNPNP